MPRRTPERAELDLCQQEKNRGQLDPKDSNRQDIALLAEKGCIGAEIGVDTGQLSERFLKLDHFSSFHSVDKWDDKAHSERQYWAVAEKLMGYSKSRIWRMTAQKFATLVPDEMFGFIYIDCYAHTGQNSGEVLECMWPKLKPGGIFSGDDYDARAWKLTVAAVDAFAASVSLPITIENNFIGKNKIRMDGHPTWWIRKPEFEE